MGLVVLWVKTNALGLHWHRGIAQNWPTLQTGPTFAVQAAS